MQKDPAFHRPKKVPDTEEMKRITAIRLRKYCQYNFLHPDTAKLPYKRKVRSVYSHLNAFEVRHDDLLSDCENYLLLNSIETSQISV